MQKSIRIVNATLLIAVMAISMMGALSGFGAAQTPSPKDAGTTPSGAYSQLADESSIVDPRGQSVKQNQKLELGRQAKLDIINPVDWNLELKGIKIIRAKIPIDLDLTLGMTFPVNAKTSYDPYDVHAGSSFPYVVEVNNDNCTPYATVGVDFNFDLNQMDVQIAELPTLDFGIDWKPISYKNQWNIPFYGTNTKVGNWIDYDIINEYYGLDTILGVFGLPSVSEYGVKGGIGVNVKYTLKSYVTAAATATSRFGSVNQNLRWDEFGAKEVNVAVNSGLTHGELMAITVGNWTYHIAHEVTFTIWADIGFDVIGINLIDETFKYAYTLGLGELTFPEKNDYEFQSKPQVLAGKSSKNVPATWTALGIDWDPSTGGKLTAFDADVAIPTNDKLARWFDDMDVTAAVSASLNVDFPFNMKSYYNARRSTPGSTLDYNVLVDSVGANNPNINYKVGGYVDLSQVEILGYNLDKYELSTKEILFNADGLYSPFGTATFEYEITDLVMLDKLSDYLNSLISKELYGINPDIQFQAWVVLSIEGKMTAGTISLANNNAGATITQATNALWDEQFDTQTTRINIPSGATPGQKFDVVYSGLKYNIKVTPGIKLGVSVLGGIVGFDYTFMIPGVSGYLTQDFTASDWTETVTVQSLNVETSALSVGSDDTPVADGDYIVDGSFTLTNAGTVSDNYYVQIDAMTLPAGTTGTWNINGGANKNLGTASVENLAPIAYTINFNLNLGPNAHSYDYLKNSLLFKVTSTTNSEIVSTIGLTLDLRPNSNLISTKVIVESAVNVVPGVETEVPIRIKNAGQLPVTYTLSFTGTDSNVGTLSETSFYLPAGSFQDVDFDIKVPALSTSAPGTKSIGLKIASSAGDMVKTINYEIQPFSNPSMKLNPAVDATETIDIGNDAVYQFKLKNDGNIAKTFEVHVDGMNAYTINTAAGAQNITVGAGLESDVVVKLSTASLGPGLHNFTVVAENDDDVFYSALYDVRVKQISVSCYAETYEYTNSPITYTISVTNKGSDDTFSVDIIGLDDSAYTLDASAKSFFLPKDGAKTITMTVKPTDLKAVAGGANGFRVAVTSVKYSTTDENTISAVKLPQLYQFKISLLSRVVKHHDTYIEVIFTIVNDGNVPETFRISVDGAEGMAYTVNSSAIVPTATGAGNITVRRGTTQEVSVKITKAKEGLFWPKINVFNSKGEKMQTFAVMFGVGAFFTYGLLIIAIATCAILGSIVVIRIVHRKQTEKYMDTEDRLARDSKPSFGGKLKEKFSNVKSKIDEKRETKAMERVRKEREEDRVNETLKSKPMIDISVGWVDQDATLEDTTSKITPEDSSSNDNSGRFSKLKEKIAKKKEEEKEIKEKARDSTFWDN